MPYPLPLTRTEAYLAYKAGVIQQSDLKPSLAVPRNGIDAWLAYWTGLTTTYPVKNVGKNLFNKNIPNVIVGTVGVSGYSAGGNNKSFWIKCKGNTTYTIQKRNDGNYNRFIVAATDTFPIQGTPVYGRIQDYDARSITITTDSSAKYIVCTFYRNQETVLTEQELIDSIQVEKGSTATTYEPYSGEPLILQEEEAYIAYLSGVINEYPEKCLRRVGAYLRYLISARWGRPDHPLNREELYLSLIKTQVVPSGDPSSDIVIDGTAKAPFVDVKMYGDTFQQTYTGKNLFNAEAIPYVARRAYGPGGAVLSWSDYTGTDEYQPVEPNTQYALWNNKTSDTTYICEYDENKNFIQRLVAVRTFTTTSTTKYLRWSLSLGAGAGTTPPTQTQLELGSTATSYEPFVGGQPSPSPDYPQPIQTVTGEQTVTVTGKNKINMPYRESKWDGARVLQNGTTLTMKPNSTSGISMSYSTPAIPVAIPTGETITWSRTWLGGTWDSGAFTFPLEITYSDGTTETISLGDTTKHNYLVAASRSVTLAKDVVSVRLLNALCYSIKEMTGDIVFGIQLEYGSTATTYTPYSSTNYPISLGSIELCKLGDYQDYIWKDGEDWKVHKTTNKSSIDGTTGTWSNPSTNRFNLDGAIAGYAKQNGLTGYCEDYVVLGQTSNNSDFNTLASNYGFAINFGSQSSNNIRFKNTACSTIQEIQTALASNSISIYYALATATDTIITDTDLVAQLEALKNGGAENGTTYIKVNATDHNLPGLLYVEAPKYE